MKEQIAEMENYATLHNVPIVEKETIAYIMKYIKKNDIRNILEIGSAIGYSAILMAGANSEAKVTTIERDEVRYMECLKNIKKVGFDKRINVVYQDALEVNLPKVEYDLIFIDAAKAQNIKFFEKYKHFLSSNGIIITDNINFHGYTGHSAEIESKNLKSLVSKIEEYVEFLKTNDEFTTEFLNIGDGIAVSTRKDEK